MADAHIEIANIKKTEHEVDLKDKIYIGARKISFVAVSSWLIQKAIRNKIELKRRQKKQAKQTLKDEITLGM